MLSQSNFLKFTLFFMLISILGLVLAPAAPLYAQTTPTVEYIAGSRTIRIGLPTGDTASQSITLTELATALANQGHTDVLVEQDQATGTWLLTANIEIRTTARLQIAAPVQVLRLESTASRFVRILAEQGGYLLINGVKVTSWDTTTNAVDETTDSRSYLLATEGGRMDILNSEVAYLGYLSLGQSSGPTSGVSWYKRLNALDPLTGSTGRVDNSNFHHNKFGIFASQAYSLTILSSQIHDNLQTGLHITDGAQTLDVGSNTVTANGEDGILVTKESPNNNIHDNTVHSNAQHGISLDRTSNTTVAGNTIYNNQDGIALSQASDNTIRGNNTHDNKNGIRVSAGSNTLAGNNQLTNNTVANNTENGIYFYSHADNNFLTGNTVTGSQINGIYIKSGNNRLERNTITGNATGLKIAGEGETEVTPPLAFSGSNNLVISSTISSNSEIGIRIEGGNNNGIGADPQTGALIGGNQIKENGREGIFIKSASNGAGSVGNIVKGNTIQANGASGVAITTSGSLRNRISQNSITANSGNGIKVDGGAQGGIQPPVITDVLADGQVLGTAAANTTVEVYTDPGGEGATYLGSATVDGSGNWSFQLPGGQDFKQVTALVIDGSGNTSAFSARSGSTAQALYKLLTDENSQQYIQVTAPDEVAVTLKDVSDGLGSNTGLVVDQGNGIWLLNANLKIERNVTLNLSPDTGVNELRLRSASSAMTNTIDYSSFVYLRVHDGVINIGAVTLHSWDAGANDVDRDPANGRAFIIAKYTAALNIHGADISYLGSGASEGTGVTWKDANEGVMAAAPQAARVTGEVADTSFHNNLYGAQAIQASDVVFRNNKFYDNESYGFNARDKSKSLVLEGNEAYNNGSHGFLITDCDEFTLRNNKAYNNNDTSVSTAHGVVIEQGTVNSLLEGNELYGNEGYGLRIRAASNNEIRGNNIHNNQKAISLEEGSSANLINNNTIDQSSNHGLEIQETADGNTLEGNTISGSVDNGIYIHANKTIVRNNLVKGNQRVGIALAPKNTTALQENSLISNTVTGNLSHGLDIRGSNATDIDQNRIETNGGHGIYLTDNASNSMIIHNIIDNNTERGIRAAGAATFGNTWTANQIYGNTSGGIDTVDGAHPNITAPVLQKVEKRTLTGKAQPGVTVDVYSDDGNQGHNYLGTTSADATSGDFTFTVFGSWIAPNVTAIATDAEGNSSVFSKAITVPEINPDYLLLLPLITK
ncbi:MAG: right-handed parallel beta-helix repeat-containing protein [Caldilineaceae bacterium]